MKSPTKGMLHFAPNLMMLVYIQLHVNILVGLGPQEHLGTGIPNFQTLPRVQG